MLTIISRLKGLGHFLRHLSWPIAARAAALICVVIGASAVLAFLLNAPWYARILAGFFLSGTWLALYEFEYCYRTRRTLGRQS